MHDSGLRKQVAVSSPAKINLSLEILAKRPDGYHDIVTVFQAIELSDQLTFYWNADKMELVCDDVAIPLGESNLIIKALRAVEKQIGTAMRVKITLDKKIPMGAGLGGGSSNAATVLLEAGRRFNLSHQTLKAMAGALGADVAFFLDGGTALGKGKGESLEALPALPKLPIVVVKPPFSISTPDAYGRIKHYSSGEKTTKLVERIKTGKLDNIFEYFTNDFEEALFPDYPQLKEIKEAFIAGGALAAQLSGSGSAVFAFARDEKQAKTLASISEKFGRVFVTSTI